MDRDRATLFAQHGAEALTIRWFGGVAQRPAPHEVPLETFFAAVDRLAPHCDWVAVVGSSFGAEAALLTAVHDERVHAVVAVAPSAVVWAGYDGGRCSSHWTLEGEQLPFVPLLADWVPSESPPYRGLYAASLAANPLRTAAAAIPVERIDRQVVLIAGGDDQVWPSADFAGMVADRRARYGLPSTVIAHSAAGHRIRFPGELPVKGGQSMARGGTPQADAALGRLAWPHVAQALRLSWAAT
jgi:uncharacterized protein